MEIFQIFKNTYHDKQLILTEKYAALKELNDTVANNPGIKKWLSERPNQQTDSLAVAALQSFVRSKSKRMAERVSKIKE